MKALLIFLLSFIATETCWSADLPSDDQVMSDYNYVYFGLEGEYELDASLYDFRNGEPLFPDYAEEERLGHLVVFPDGFIVENVNINKYEGYFIDTLNEQCIVLIRPIDRPPSGVYWGVPYSVLLLYRYNNNAWELKYSTEFYDEADLVQLDKKNKISLLHARNQTCSNGTCQWQESMYAFSINGPEELFYDISLDRSMYVQWLHKDDRSEFKRKYHDGDTLGRVRLLDMNKDIDEDGIDEIIRYEDITILRRPIMGKPKYDRYIRFYKYKYLNGKLILVETTDVEPLIEPY